MTFEGAEVLPHPHLRRARTVVVVHTAWVLAVSWLVVRASPPYLGLLRLVAAAMLVAGAAALLLRFRQVSDVGRTLRCVRRVGPGARFVAAEVVEAVESGSRPPTWRVAARWDGAQGAVALPPAAGEPLFLDATGRTVAALIDRDGAPLPLAESGYPVFVPRPALDRAVASLRGDGVTGAPVAPGSSEGTAALRPTLPVEPERPIPWALGIPSLAIACATAWAALLALPEIAAAAVLTAGGGLIWLAASLRARHRRVTFVRMAEDGITLRVRNAERLLPWPAIDRVAVARRGGWFRPGLPAVPERDPLLRRLARAGVADDGSPCWLEFRGASSRHSLLCTEPVEGRTARAVALEARARGVAVEAA